MTIDEIHSLFLECTSATIDTRKIEANSMFFAIKGENFDANIFANEAISKGAKYAIIDNPDYSISGKTILVADTLTTLQELAKFHRRFLGIPIIALTGSNGKTTTKELINTVLSKKYNTIATIGNLNNHIGVPLTLLRLTNQTEMGIIEMGANHQQEIAFLCEIAQPDFGYITNFGKAHLEGFGGLEGVIKGKSEMYDYLLKNDKLAFINLDDPIQIKQSNGIKNSSFSTKNETATVVIKSIEANPMVTITYHDVTINSNLIGIYNATNISAAIAIGTYFNVGDAAIKNAIENYLPDNNRSQVFIKNGNKIILDAYNANPSSMAAAITNFISLTAASKFAILGDMFELGDESLSEHKNIISLLEDETTITTFFVGNHFYKNKITKTNLHFFEDFTAFELYLIENLPENSLLLIKGSRGMALERVLNIL